jgi:hypothetical protein
MGELTPSLGIVMLSLTAQIAQTREEEKDVREWTVLDWLHQMYPIEPGMGQENGNGNA